MCLSALMEVDAPSPCHVSGLKPDVPLPVVAGVVYGAVTSMVNRARILAQPSGSQGRSRPESRNGRCTEDETALSLSKVESSI